MRQIYRSASEGMIAGVAAGMADYLGLDVALVRLLWVLFIFMGGIGIPVYIVAWIIIPEEPYPGAGKDYREKMDAAGKPVAKDRSSYSPSSQKVQADCGGNPGQSGQAKHASQPDETGRTLETGEILKMGQQTLKDEDDICFGGENTFDNETVISRETGTDGRVSEEEGRVRERTNQALGVFLVIIGAAFLMRETLHLDVLRFVWPIMLVILGVYILINDRRGS